MWSKKRKRKPRNTRQKCRRKLRYSRYYEHDGALRAYANRAMVLAFLCVPTTCWLSASPFTSACSRPRSFVWMRTARRSWWARQNRNCRSRRASGRSQRSSRSARSCACSLSAI